MKARTILGLIFVQCAHSIAVLKSSSLEASIPSRFWTGLSAPKMSWAMPVLPVAEPAFSRTIDAFAAIFCCGQRGRQAGASAPQHHKFRLKIFSSHRNTPPSKRFIVIVQNPRPACIRQERHPKIFSDCLMPELMRGV